MTHNRHASVHNAANRARYGDAAFHFHGVRPGFLHQPAGVAQRFPGIDLVGHERQVNHHQRLRRPPAHHPPVPDHIVHGHRHGGIVTQHNHAQAVAHQDDRDAGGVGDARRRVIVGGDHGDFLPGPLHLGQLSDRDRHRAAILSVRHADCPPQLLQLRFRYSLGPGQRQRGQRQLSVEGNQMRSVLQQQFQVCGHRFRVASYHGPGHCVGRTLTLDGINRGPGQRHGRPDAILLSEPPCSSTARRRHPTGWTSTRN